MKVRTVAAIALGLSLVACEVPGGAAAGAGASNGGASSGGASSGGASSGGSSSGGASSGGSSSGGSSSGGASSGGSSSGGSSSGGSSGGTCAAAGTGRVSINAGGDALGTFLADGHYSGGSIHSTSSVVDTSQLPCAPPASVFQTERYGEFTYTIPGRAPGTAQSVTLYFQESYFDAAGKRTFDVAINGATVLSAFDIFAEAGGAGRAVAKTFATTADASGQVVVRFTRNGPDQPKVCGITVDGEGQSPPPPPPVLVATPPMGWNSWNTFGCNLDEGLIKGIADVMVSSGMKDAGYEYVNLDDCWMDGRDGSGNLRWNTSKFPSGIAALADYVHSKGLKIGIYETPATLTCAGRYGGMPASKGVGSLGHETADARAFASWGIDYLKYDLCLGDRNGFAVMRDALRATGRTIVYSINPGNGQGDLCPPDRCALDLPSIANLWRIGFDIDASWNSWMRLLDENAGLSSYAGPGHFNDPDMMEVGRGRTETEDRAHFSLWAIMAAPLIAGNDLRTMSAATRAILTNAEVIAVDQDPLGIQGRVVETPGSGLQVWSKTLSGTNARAVALFNRNTAAAPMTVHWSALGIPAGAATVRDLWSHSDLGSFTGSYTAPSVPGHGVVMLKVVAAP